MPHERQTRMFDRIRRLLGKAPEVRVGLTEETSTLDEVRVGLTEEMTVTELREMLAGEKEFRVRATPDGKFTATCKSCLQGIRLMPQGEILWLRCPQCLRVTCYPGVNVGRDLWIAKKEGQPFEYELYFNQDWMGLGLTSPFGMRSGVLQIVSSDQPRCPQCSAPYNPADYRDDAAVTRCSRCGATLPR